MSPPRIVRVEITPRMEEIRRRAERAWDGVTTCVDDATRKQAITEFHRRSMEDVTYLLRKLGVMS